MLEYKVKACPLPCIIFCLEGGHMQVKWGIEDRKLTFKLAGELDHHAAKEILREMGEVIDERLPLRCAIDLAGLTFMDSSGIAVILGAYRRLYEIGGELFVINVPRQAARVLQAAGVDKIVTVRHNLQPV